MSVPAAISNDARVSAVADWFRARGIEAPAAGIILGTGLGRLAEHVTDPQVFSYNDIPHFPRSTAPGHAGRLFCGRLANLPVVCLQGRFHSYEGYHPAETAFPVHVMRALGAELLIVSNAAGGMNPHYRAGDVMVVMDHLNLMGAGPRAVSILHQDPTAPVPSLLPARQPWCQETAESCIGLELIPRSITPYDGELAEQALGIARKAGFTAQRGIYVAVRGPNFETRAEYRLFRRLGGDVVGMSTVPEVLAAAQHGMRVLALSTITNVCLPDALRPTSGAAVIAAADGAAEKVRQIVLGILQAEAARKPGPAQSLVAE